MEAGESSISSPEIDGWTLIREHSDEELEDQEKTNDSPVSTKSTKHLTPTGAAKCKFSTRRSPPPFKFHVTVEPEISGHDTIIRITKLCDTDPTEEFTESNYFDIDDDGDEIIYLSDSPPPVEKPVKQKKKRSRKRKMSLETIHEHDSPPLRSPSADHEEFPESDDDIVILPQKNKKRKLDKSPKLAAEKSTDELDIVPTISKKGKVIKLAQFPREVKKDDKSSDQKDWSKSDEDTVILTIESEEENSEKPSVPTGKRGDGPKGPDDELVIIPKRKKKRKAKVNDNMSSRRVVSRDNFDMSAPSWTVTVELDDDDNYKVVDDDIKVEETSEPSPDVTNAANTLLKISEESAKMTVIKPSSSSKPEPSLSDSQSSTEKADDDNISVKSVGEEDNSKWFGPVETKVIKSENGRRVKTMCVCPCGMMFSHRSGLSRHRRIVHLGMTYRCQMCGEHFTRSDSLNDHIRRLEHWNPLPNSPLSPSVTPTRGAYKDFESQGERPKSGKKKAVINYEIVNKVLEDGTQKATLVAKDCPSKNDSDSKCDDVEPEKESDPSDAASGENTESPQTGLVASEANENGETESPEQSVVTASAKDAGSDSEPSSPGEGSVGDEQKKSDNLESTVTSKVTTSNVNELSPSHDEASPAVVSLASKLVQMGTRKLTLSSSAEGKPEKIKPRTLIKEILCSPRIAVLQSTQGKADVAGQKSMPVIMPKSRGNDGAEDCTDAVVVDVSAPIVSTSRDNPKVLEQATQAVSEKNVDGKPRVIVWPTMNESANSRKSDSSLTKVHYPAPLKAVSPSPPVSLALPSPLQPLPQVSTAGAASPTTVSQQPTSHVAPQSVSVLKPVTTATSVVRLPEAWTGLIQSPITASTPRTQSSKSHVLVQPAAVKPTTTQILVQSAAPVRAPLSALGEPVHNDVPTVTYTVAQAPVPIAQTSVAAAQSSAPTAQGLAPAQGSLPAAQSITPTAQPPSLSADQSSPTDNLLTQPALSSVLGTPLVLTPTTPTVPQPAQTSQTAVTLSAPLLTQTIQQLITTPSGGLASSPLPTNPTHALMETLLQSLMRAPIRTMSQPAAAAACTSAGLDVPVVEAGSKETAQEVMFLLTDALSEK